MLKRLSAFLTLSLLLALSQKAVAQSFTMKDRLKSRHDIGCVKAEALKPIYTPADLSKAVSTCNKEMRFEDAFHIFFIYTIYGGYDAERVKDETAKDAMSVLNLRIFHSLTPETRKGFQAEVIKMADVNSPQYLQACDHARRVGPPDYYPAYMIAHGRMALSEGIGDGMKENFDPEETWAQVFGVLNGCALE